MGVGLAAAASVRTALVGDLQVSQRSLSLEACLGELTGPNSIKLSFIRKNVVIICNGMDLKILLWNIAFVLTWIYNNKAPFSFKLTNVHILSESVFGA